MTLPFQGPQTWTQKVLEADEIWAKVSSILEQNSLALPQTPRRPDVRVVLANTETSTLVFPNPGKYGDKLETIKPGEAAMVMLKGTSLPEQFAAAEEVVRRYGLAEEGLTQKFLAALASGAALDCVDEAYGPAPFEKQAKQLVDVNWPHADGTVDIIIPQKTAVCAFGARAAAGEKALRTSFAIYVKGTNTIPERVEGEGMVIAISEDWETKAITTRPIVPSVAKTFYGAHYPNIPVASIHPDGFIEVLDLKNGSIIDSRLRQQAAVANGPGL